MKVDQQNKSQYQGKIPETRRDWPTVWMGGEAQPFPHLADGFKCPRLGETNEVQIAAIESAEVSFDQ